MAYPRTAESLRKKGVGVSLTGETIARVTVLAGGIGERSKFLGEIIVLGLERRYGSNWQVVADAIRIAEADKQEVEAA
jgi:hypothetical protein